jgi:Rad3-related DNA helicase
MENLENKNYGELTPEQRVAAELSLKPIEERAKEIQKHAEEKSGDIAALRETLAVQPGENSHGPKTATEIERDEAKQEKIITDLNNPKEDVEYLENLNAAVIQMAEDELEKIDAMKNSLK